MGDLRERLAQAAAEAERARGERQRTSEELIKQQRAEKEALELKLKQRVALIQTYLDTGNLARQTASVLKSKGFRGIKRVECKTYTHPRSSEIPTSPGDSYWSDAPVMLDGYVINRYEKTKGWDLLTKMSTSIDNLLGGPYGYLFIGARVSNPIVCNVSYGHGGKFGMSDVSRELFDGGYLLGEKDELLNNPEGFFKAINKDEAKAYLESRLIGIIRSLK